MKKIVLLITFMVLVMIGFGQKPADYNKRLNKLYKFTVPLINVDELHEAIAENKQLFILDSREENEFKVSHIKNAISIGYEKFTIKDIKKIPKDATIVVYCSLGVRSEEVGMRIKEAGYQEVFNLYGGIFEWVHKDYDVIDKKGNSTKKVELNGRPFVFSSEDLLNQGC